jgi:hypothetical protein
LSVKSSVGRDISGATSPEITTKELAADRLELFSDVRLGVRANEFPGGPGYLAVAQA